MRIQVSLLLLLLSLACRAQETEVSIASAKPVKVYRVDRLRYEDSASLFPRDEFRSSDLSFVGTTPLNLKLPNGLYVFNVGGNEKYNKAFSFTASGRDIKVDIKGNLEGARKDELLLLGFGAGFLLSFTTVKLINDQLPADRSYVGFILPISLGCGFGYGMGKWIYDLPKVRISQ